MNALTVTLGTIGVVFSLVAWASFFGGVGKMVRAIMIGQSAPDRWRPFLPRLKTMIVEFLAHTRMNKFRTVGWAHWLVMIGFLAGFILYFEAYGQTFDPTFHWPGFGNWHIYHLMDEVLGIATVIGILVLITIRQLNHPRVPARLSRFTGSRFVPAYIIESIVLIEGLGMVLVKAGKIATYHESTAWTDFFTMQVAKLLPDSVALVAVFAFVKMVSGSTFLLLVGRNINWGVAWHRFAAFFNIYFKREQDGGVALGAAKPMMSQGKPIDMETADPDTDTFGAGRIEDFSWKGWLDFTTCTECGRCQSQCPAWNTGKPLSPKLMIMSLRDHGQAKAPYLLAGGRRDAAGDEVGLVDADGKPDEHKLAGIPAAARAEAERPLIGDAEAGGIFDPEALWSCTTCGACVEQCPVDIEHVDHIIDMRRYQVLIESEFPSELAGLFKNLENKGNPWGQNAKDRLNWISELDFEIPVFGQDADSFDGYEYLFWVGCAGAYEDRAKKTTKAVAELLATAGTKFMVLGAEETCTGDSARRAGNEFLFQQLAMQNIELLNSVFEGVADNRKKIVVTCAHCFNALSNEYPQVGGVYEVVHHTQLLNRLVRQKKLVPVASVSQQVTYHDPCYLGRHNKIYNAPRELIEGAGATLTEMPRHGERSMCCGAGGARMWMEEQLGKRVNLDRTDEALSTLDGGNTPSLIATGCPFCRVMLTDGVTARKDSGEVGQETEVVDVSQLMLNSISRVEPETLSANLKVVQEPKAEPEPAAPTPVATATTPEAAPAADKGATPAADKGAAPAAGKGLAMKGGKAPGGGLGMKGAAKAPGGATAAAPATEAEAAPEAEAPAAPAAKSGGLGMKGGAKAPGGGLGMKGAAKAPGAKAPGAKAPAGSAAAASAPAEAPAAESAPAEAPAAEAAAAPAAKPGGLAMKRAAKAPGAKAPGAKPTAAAPAAESAAAEAPAAETATETPAAPATPTAKPGGLAMKRAAKAPGAKAPGTKPAAGAPTAAATPAEASTGDAAAEASADATASAAAESTTPAAESAADAPAAPSASATETKPTVPAKGLAMKSGFKRPGPKAPGAAKTAASDAESTATESAAPASEPAAPAASSATPAAESAAVTESAAAEKSAPATESAAPAEKSAPATASATPAEKPAAESAEATPAPAGDSESKAAVATGEAAAPAEEEAATATSEPTDTAEPAEAESTSESGSTATTSNGNGSTALPTAKPGGLGFKSGAKAPGRKN
ncbi:heterodisulfide reductase-related iron-sulfur binding cluster [Nocardia sp. BMG111209]|uniref:heterodisulfide reductase-related iron-sulfur binding cluster n=1 Tax=Nocardia sp. BMG111209 TaxID=1160137 RepID=UPI0003675CD7|nr:heterodisulfide reductase-related iron-sulfur binding cluster [Nocardia sp. BMG111209]